MTAAIIDGKEIARALRDRVGQAVAALDFAPGLAVVLVGDDPASEIYVRNKGAATRTAGMRSIEHRLPATVREAELVALVRALNADDAIDGVLVQMPLPLHIDAHRVINEIAPEKDVDGLTEVNAGRLILGKRGLEPCTPQGCVLLAKSVAPDLAGLNAVVVGRSILVGKPLAMLLLAENCTVTLAHSRTRDLAAVCRTADILCAAIGKPEMLGARHIREGAIVIDVGINRIMRGGKQALVGDVDFVAASGLARAATPVPGGVGPMTIACLLRNTLVAAARRRGAPDPEI